MGFEQLIADGKFKRISSALDMVEKELSESDYDLAKAKKCLENEDFKWAIVKSYYAMFHSAKAVLIKNGFMEKSHFAVYLFLEELGKDGKLNFHFINDFKAAMHAREGADYHYKHSSSTAEDMVKMAEEFIEEMKLVIEKF